MAASDSAIGYAVTTFNDPVTTRRSDSEIGYGVATFVDPATTTPAARSDSAIGFGVVTFTDPSLAYKRGDSAIGFAITTFTPPHQPLVMRTAAGIRRFVQRMSDGTRLR